MRIDRIESFTRPDVGFVRVTSEDGAFGWGQMSTYHADITAQVLHRQVAPWVTGRFIDANAPVVDFLDIMIGSFNWYIFNVADSAVTSGMILFILHTIIVGEKKPVSGV